MSFAREVQNTRMNSIPMPIRGAVPRGKRRVNLALQGGGSHGAFTWGVLDALLEDGRLEFDGISGASAGAVNAVALAHGFASAAAAGGDAAAGRAAARATLEQRLARRGRHRQRRCAGATLRAAAAGRRQRRAHPRHARRRSGIAGPRPTRPTRWTSIRCARCWPSRSISTRWRRRRAQGVRLRHPCEDRPRRDLFRRQAHPAGA